MKKYLFTYLVMAIFAIGFAASDETSSPSSTENEEKVQEQKPAPKPDFLGTYVVKDKAGLTYKYIFKENGTVDIIINSALTVTGKWKDCRKENCGLQICFDDIDKIPAIQFPYGIHSEAMDKCAYFCEGYYYPDFFTCDDRKEGWRVEYTKID